MPTLSELLCVHRFQPALHFSGKQKSGQLKDAWKAGRVKTFTMKRRGPRLLGSGGEQRRIEQLSPLKHKKRQ
uniref:Tyrosine decarboxylase 1-like isoform X2 n=1 Tax=Rhizophora mucronata TaxID=61149 RepID=A0A2P2K7B3_RHIMU